MAANTGRGRRRPEPPVRPAADLKARGSPGPPRSETARVNCRLTLRIGQGMVDDVTDAPISLQMLIEHAERQRNAADPLSTLSAAVSLATVASTIADELIDHFVAAARESGSSWSEIGERLGVSRQAAHQRFGGSHGAAGDCKQVARPMTPRVRRALRRAHLKARRAGLESATTQHLLLELLHERGGVAVRVLDMLGVDAAVVARGLEPPVDDAEARTPTSDEPDAADCVSRQALAEAARLGHDHVGTEHVLLALLVVPGHARDVLARCAADYETVQKAACELLEGPLLRRGRLRAGLRA